MMDIFIHIPKIPFKINIDNLSYDKSILKNICNYSYLNHIFINQYINKDNDIYLLGTIKSKYKNILLPFQNYDLLNYELCCNYTYIHELYYSLNFENKIATVLLNEKEKYIFDNLSKLSSTNNSRNKKIVVLYNLSKFLIREKNIKKEKYFTTYISI